MNNAQAAEPSFAMIPPNPIDQYMASEPIQT